jgi:hypothetical protein
VREAPKETLDGHQACKVYGVAAVCEEVTKEKQGFEKQLAAAVFQSPVFLLSSRLPAAYSAEAAASAAKAGKAFATVGVCRRILSVV